MNPEVKALWVAALRSNEYRQGKGALKQKGKDGPEYCCLGVLCEVAIQNGVEVNHTHPYEAYFYDESDMKLPQSVMQWAGLRNANPTAIEIPESGISREFALAELNDGSPLHNVEQWTFAQIADLIEEKF